MTRSFCPALIFTVVFGLVASPAASQTDRLGHVTFPTSSQSQRARASFLRGVLYLHNFEYADAGEAFRRAQTADPDFAMAYWGEALSHDHPLWGEEDLEAARDVLARLAPTPEARRRKAPTAREKAYLDAVEALFGPGGKAARDSAYAEAMRRVHERWPEDLDAAAFYALSLLGSVEDRHVPTYMRAAAVAERTFDEDPDHPGLVHYLIHAYDDPVHAPLGLRPARVYARIAPDAPHALHMPSHVFIALGRWEDVRASNERSWTVSVEKAARRGRGVEAQNFHALFWLHYADLQVGEQRAAGERLRLARDALLESDAPGVRWHVAQMRAQHLVHDIGAGRDLVAALSTKDVGDRVALANLLAVAVNGLQNERPALVRTALDEARALAPHEGDAEVAFLELEALGLLVDGEVEAALRRLEAAVERQDALPFVFGPPTPAVKPPAELHGEVLLRLDRPREAAGAFRRALARYPGRRLSVSGLDRARNRIDG